MATLSVITTPIGNMEDLGFRALRALQEVDALACEDTRVTRKIFLRHELPLPRTVFSCHEHNEEQAAKRILGLLDAGVHVGMCSDGGSPSISEPGYRVIGLVLDSEHTLEVIPGPSAVSTAVVASGLSTSSYTFKGFPPRRTGARKRFLEEESALAHTLVVFESPYRIGKLLADAFEVMGDRRAAVCVELTKKFEKIHRGYLGELAEQFDGTKVKGEITLVIAGNNPKFRRELSKG